MTDPLVIETEAILAELREKNTSSRGISVAARNYIVKYYPEFAKLRAVPRFVEMVNQVFQLHLSRYAVQNLYQQHKRAQ